MRFIRSKGLSFTDFQEGGELTRSLKVTKRSEITDGPEVVSDLSTYATTDPQLLIRQFISVIDKIFKKPIQLGKMSEDWYQARERLGEACWSTLTSKHLTDTDVAELQATWRWKLHPYSETNSVEGDLNFIRGKVNASKDWGRRNGKPYREPKFQGRWYAGIVGELSDQGSIDFDSIAELISSHLMMEELTITGEPRVRRDVQLSSGLAAARAKSIEKSVYQKHKGLEHVFSETLWTPADEKKYAKPDVAASIWVLAKKREDSKGRINNQSVGKILFQHYADIGLADPAASICPATKDGLHALHDAVKKYYKVKLRTSKRGTKDHNGQRLSASLPRTFNELLTRLNQQSGNRLINDLVRHGRNQFFARSGERPAEDSAAKARSVDELRQFFWTSDGQAQIKRSEAFTRVWRTIVSQASRTAKSWADPDGKLSESSGGYDNDDILNDKLIKMVTGEGFNPADYDPKLDILFGSRASIFRPEGQEEQKNLFQAVLKITAKIRNSAFHFSNRENFVADLMKSITAMTEASPEDETGLAFSAKTQSSINELIAEDAGERIARLISDLSGLGLQNFTTESIGNGFVKSIAAREETDLAVPRFNRVLDRHDGTREVAKGLSDDRVHLPKRANRLVLSDEASLCKFGCMKLVYERVFAAWLTRLSASEVNSVIEITLSEGAERAKLPQGRQNPYRDLIRAKASNLPPVGEEGLVGLFNDLAHEIATELRQQNAYEVNPETAREQSGWIEDFKCDLLAILFPQFLRQNGYGWLLDLKAETKPKEGVYKLSVEPEEAPRDFEPWEANLYLFLHLVPVDDVARLIHQFRKTAVLEEKGDHLRDQATSVVKAAQGVLSLYMDMHNAKFTGDTVNIGLAPFREMFEHPEDFDGVYNEGLDQDHTVMSTRRGLRQIMRFGHLRVLNDSFSMNKVSHDDVDAVQKAELAEPGSKSQIELDQTERQDLHSKLSKLGKKPTTPDQVDRYQGLMDAISEHRQKASRVRLTDHVRVHQIMMRVISRLIDFAGVWERDKFLVFLALAQSQFSAGDQAGTDKLPKCLKAAAIKAREVDASYLNEANLALFNEHFSDERTQIRNRLAHFSVLASQNLPLNLTHEVNQVRKLMSYDRKLKNSVTKSIIELMDREGFKLSWKVKDHEMVEPAIDGRSIRHLKDLKVAGSNGKATKARPIWETFHSAELQNMVGQTFGAEPKPITKPSKKPLKTLPAPAGYLDGTLKFMITEKGFGFIVRDDGEGDVFVHISEAQKAVGIEMSPGRALRFKITTGRNGRPCAVDLSEQ